MHIIEGNMSNKRFWRTGIYLLLGISVLVFIAASYSQSAAQQSNFDAAPLVAGARYTMVEDAQSLNERVIDPKLELLVHETAVSIIVTYDTPFDVSTLTAFPNSEIANTYQRFNGVSMILPGDQVTAVTLLPNITGVYADALQPIQSTGYASTAFIVNEMADVDAGAGTLFATIDTGVWPEHPSFAPLASAPSGASFPCEFGNTGWHADDVPFSCNNKLVGAYAFLETYKSLAGLTAVEFDSARDDNGHGTHTATIAAGNATVHAEISGTDMGTISGLAPQAQLIAYKACGAAGCYASDLLAAIDQAILDDVDVINLATVGSADPFADVVSQSLLEAYENGIFVTRPAGNSGPSPDSVAGSDPWVMTVGSVNVDNEIAAFSGRGGPGQTLGISQPDITAPGVGILAGYSPATAAESFQVMDGTSMSAAAVAGVALQLKATHPDWTPGEMKSALMLTAVSDTSMLEDGTTAATPFDSGSGLVNPEKAVDPGLTMSISGDDYLNNKDHLWESNYPSIYVPDVPGGIKLYRTVHSELTNNTLWRMRIEAPDDLMIKTRRAFGIRPNQERRISIRIDASRVPFGEVRHATIILEQMRGERTLHLPLTIVRSEPSIVMTNQCNPRKFSFLSLANCSITITNLSEEDTSFTLVDHMPRGLLIVPWGVSGATQDTLFSIKHSGSLAGAELDNVEILDATGQTFGYVSLASIGLPSVGPVGDDEVVNFDLLANVQYGGVTYSRVGMVSNGYLVMGGGSAVDVSAMNQVLPDTAVPNNVIAPFWTDLNPELGGNLYAAQITDPYGVNWMVFEWENIPNATTGELNTFQVWFGTGSEQEIYFVYGDISAGNSGLLTIGAENMDGSFGENWFANGTGKAVTTGTELSVMAIPGADGESHTAKFKVTGWHIGSFTNCAELTSDLFDGTNVACFTGEITK
jgi:hypothetical protein